jgi:hypothetical protein
LVIFPALQGFSLAGTSQFACVQHLSWRLTGKMADFSECVLATAYLCKDIRVARALHI